MTEPSSPKTGEQFSLVVGGPFHRLLRRLGLTGPDALPTRCAVLLLALAAWALPAVLVIAQALLDDRYSGWGFFADWTVHTRYLLAVGIMIATERYADGRLNTLARHFRAAHIVSDAEEHAFRSALARADRRSASIVAELVILAAALSWPGLTAHYAVHLSGTGWDGVNTAGGSVLSWAGEAARWVSTPLFLFLMLRWLWRFLVWSELLYRISRLSLQLTPLHPDRSGGLGFLANFPGIFSGFVFALSCVVAAAMVKDLGVQEHAAQTVWFAVAGWVVLILALALGPLLVFLRPLYALRERALIDYGRLASQHHLAFQRRWILEERSGEELIGSPDPSSASDLSATVEVIQRLRFLPVDLPAMLQLLAAAGVPMLAVAATPVPVGDLLTWIAGALL